MTNITNRFKGFKKRLGGGCGVIFQSFSSLIISKILNAINEPQSQAMIFPGPVVDFSPARSARKLTTVTTTMNTKKATETLIILL